MEKKTLYKVEYWVPYANMTEYQDLTQEQIDEFKTLYDKERRNYLVINPDGANDEKKWELWLRDGFAEAEMVTTLISGITEVEAEIKFVDLDHPLQVLKR